MRRSKRRRYLNLRRRRGGRLLSDACDLEGSPLRSPEARIVAEKGVGDVKRTAVRPCWTDRCQTSGHGTVSFVEIEIANPSREGVAVAAAPILGRRVCGTRVPVGMGRKPTPTIVQVVSRFVRARTAVSERSAVVSGREARDDESGGTGETHELAFCGQIVRRKAGGRLFGTSGAVRRHGGRGNLRRKHSGAGDLECSSFRLSYARIVAEHRVGDVKAAASLTAGTEAGSDGDSRSGSLCGI